MKQIPLVRKIVLEPTLDFLRKEGVRVERHLRRANLCETTPETRESFIPLHQLCTFLNSVSRTEDIPDLGFRIAGRLGIQSLGAYGKIVMEAFTLHELIQLSMELIAGYNSGLKIWMETEGQQVRYQQKYEESLSPRATREIVHLGLANALGHAHLVLGADFQPYRIELPTNPIELTNYFPALDKTSLDFNQSHTTIWFDQRFLSVPLPAFRESSFATNLGASERCKFLEKAPPSGFAGQIEEIIESTLEQPETSLPMLAAITGISSRTLQRRLCENNESFSRLLQKVRFQNAQRLLRDHSLPVTEVAKRLGYANLANFIRAFSRWTGIGPSKFRKLHYDSERE